MILGFELLNLKIFLGNSLDMKRLSEKKNLKTITNMIFSMELEFFVDGIFNLIYVSITIFICLYIISRYLKYKQRTLLYVGITWLGLVFAYIPIALSFLYYVITGQPLNQVVFMSAYGVVALGQVAWLLAMKDMNVIKNKIIIIILGLVLIVLLVIYYTLLMIDPDLIGVFKGVYHMRVLFTSFARIYILVVLFALIIPGLLLCYQCLKSEEPEIKLKGKILLIGFISFFIGVLMTSMIDISIVKVVARIILSTSSFEFYCGFILPDWVKNKFLKNK